MTVLAELRPLKAAKRSPIPIESKGNPWSDFLMVIKAGGICSRARTTTTATTVQCLFTAFVFCIGFVIIILRIEGRTIYIKLHRRVTKLKSKFNLILG